MILSILVGAIAVILTAIGIVICTPVKIRAGFDTEHKQPIQFNIALLGGLITIPTSSTGAKKDKLHKKTTKPSKLHRRTYWPHILRALPTLVRRLLARLKIESLTGRVKFGFPDPADTGQIFGIIYPMLYRLNRPAKHHVILFPNFERACLSGAGDFTVNFLPVTLFPPMLNFGWTAFIKPKFRRP